MPALIVYLLKGVILSGILFSYYQIGLRNKRLHYYNRFYLLSTIIISVLLPLFRFDWPSTPGLAVPAVISNTNWFARIDYRGGSGIVSVVGWERIFIIVTIAISCILLIRFLLRIYGIFSIKKEYSVTRMEDYYFIETDLPQAPFSFLNYLFWKKGISLKNDPGNLMLQHELTHIRQKHTYDKLFSQFVTCLFWMNPFYHLIRKELCLIHEFTADERSVKERDTAVLAELLLLASGMENYLEPTQAFFQSPIERRILMLASFRKRDIFRLRRITGLVLLFVSCIMVSFTLPAKPVNSPPIVIFSNSENITDTIPQQPKPKQTEWSPEKVHQLVVQIIKDPPDVSFYVNGKASRREEIRKLDPDKITSMNIFKGDDAIKRHGQKAKNGVIEFFMK